MSCLADLSLCVLENLPDPLELPADIRALRMQSPAAHLPQLAPAYAELGRVAAHGGTVLVTDFHPDAARAGHTRSFRDGNGIVHAVEHHLHVLTDHVAAAADAGLELADWRDGVIGPELRPFYEAARRLDRYAADEGLPVVLALAFRRVADG